MKNFKPSDGGAAISDICPSNEDVRRISAILNERGASMLHCGPVVELVPCLIYQ
jgi:hypothetical protein